jgi:hypothetical protein
VLPLGFRFDVDAVIVGGVAHCQDCVDLPNTLPHDAVLVGVAGTYRAERCPRECPLCRPGFETLLSYQLERTVAWLAPP